MIRALLVTAALATAAAPVDAIHEEMPAWIESFLAERGHTWEEMERGQLWTPATRPGPLPFASLDELQEYLVCSDPVRFAECVLLERDVEGHPPWRLWDYQKVSMRYRGHTIHECGSEVGKSREIVGLALYSLVCELGDQLAAGALDVHASALWKEIAWQIDEENNPWLHEQIDWNQTKQKPYVDLVAKNGNHIYFRPAGLDGSSLRSAHCGRRIFMDEATKCRSHEIWSNFFSRAKPTAEIRIYSTPDGNRDTRFFELCQATPAVEPDGSNLAAVAASTIDGVPGGRRFVRFRWGKRLMPAPFYTEARVREWIEQYGGIDTPEYQHNVLGNWGDPENSLFPWTRLARCVRPIPEYVAVKLLLDDAEGVVYASAHQLTPGYTVTGPIGDEEDGDGPATSPLRHLTVRDPVPVRELDTVDSCEQLLRRWLVPLEGHLVAGIDPGDGSDPTEVLWYRVLGKNLTCVARLQLRRFDSPTERRLLYAVRRILNPSHGWGLDATGGGSILEQELRAGDESYELAANLDGIVSNAKLLDVNPDTGEPETDPDTGKPRTVTYKELGVRTLQRDVGYIRLLLPYDPDILLEWQDFTARVSPNTGTRTFGHNKNDHTVAATICARLRLHLLEHGSGVTPPVTFASLGRRDGSPDGPLRRPGARRGGHPLDALPGAGSAARALGSGGRSIRGALSEW